MPIRNPKDFWSGALFVALGIGDDHHRLEVHARHRGANGSRLLPAHPRHAVDRRSASFSRCARRVRPALRCRAFKWRPLVIVLGSVVLFGAIVRIRSASRCRR